MGEISENMLLGHVDRHSPCGGACHAGSYISCVVCVPRGLTIDRSICQFLPWMGADSDGRYAGAGVESLHKRYTWKQEMCHMACMQGRLAMDWYARASKWQPYIMAGDCVTWMAHMCMCPYSAEYPGMMIGRADTHPLRKP